MAAKMLRVLGLSGSLRKGSYNTAALHAARELAPQDMSIEIYGPLRLPLYDEDLRAQGYPLEVQAFRDAVAACDAVLIATPEYNYSIPPALKNAIDWGSRRPDQPFQNKPVAIIGATTGAFGTARAQMHLRASCGYLDMHLLNRPEVLISFAANKFDAENRLVDEPTRGFLHDMLVTFAPWIKAINATYARG